MKSNVAALAWSVEGGVVKRLKLCGTWEEAGDVVDGWGRAGAAEVHRAEGPAEKMRDIERLYSEGRLTALRVKV